jgi:signal transduction histidine kinase
VPSDNVKVKDHVDKIKSVAETTVQTVHNIALLLRPSMLDDLGLIPALGWQGREIFTTSGSTFFTIGANERISP